MLPFLLLVALTGVSLGLSGLRPADWRGKLSSFPPHLFEVMFRVAASSGEAWSVRLPYIRTQSDVRLYPSVQRNTEAAERYGAVASGLLQPGVPLKDTIAARATYRRMTGWSVYLGYRSQPRALLATDPSGIRAFFADRDVGPTGRRDALLHWVHGHWRKRRPPSEGDMTWVREHLRGKREFAWNEMRAQVVLP